MTISYPITIISSADLAPASVNFGMDFAVSRTTSPTSLIDQVYEHTGERWFLSASYPALKADQDNSFAKRLQAFLLSLKGGAKTFYYKDSFFSTPSNPIIGTPLVKGGSQSGYTLAIDGLTHSVTGIIKAGDRFNVGTSYHVAMKDADSNGSGETTLDIMPALRSSPADNTPLTFTDPLCLMRLSSPTVSWGQSKDRSAYISFDAVEAR